MKASTVYTGTELASIAVIVREGYQSAAKRVPVPVPTCADRRAGYIYSTRNKTTTESSTVLKKISKQIIHRRTPYVVLTDDSNQTEYGIKYTSNRHKFQGAIETNI
jgi:hypothetical protein